EPHVYPELRSTLLECCKPLRQFVVRRQWSESDSLRHCTLRTDGKFSLWQPHHEEGGLTGRSSKVTLAEREREFGRFGSLRRVNVHLINARLLDGHSLRRFQVATDDGFVRLKWLLAEIEQETIVVPGCQNCNSEAAILRKFPQCNLEVGARSVGALL